MGRMTIVTAALGLVAAQLATAGEVSTPDEVFVGHAPDWTVSPAIFETDGSRSSNVMLTQATYAEGGAPTWALVAPYVWAPMMDGTVGVNGNTSNVNLSFSDLLDLIPDLNGAAMGHVEAGRGNGGFLLEALLLELSPTRRGPLGGRTTVTSELTVIEALGTLRLIGNAPGTPPSEFSLDVLGGLRYYDVTGGIRDNPIIGPTVVDEQSENWVDLVVGARTGVALTENLGGFVRGDIAGFGIGTSSQFTWNLTAGFKYACVSHPGWSAILGYRVLDIDETKYSGAERFVFDVRIHGPILALTYEF